MPLYLKKGDITAMRCDAIVNATDNALSGSGGVDRMIHEAAGPALDDECRQIGHCDTGSAVITKAYELGAEYIIHTAGPVWHGGARLEKSTLASCYISCLELASGHGCMTVAFPLISAGTFGFPEEEAMIIAKSAIEEFLQDHDMTVYLLAYGSRTYDLGSGIFGSACRYVEQNMPCDALPMYSCTVLEEASPEKVPGNNIRNKRVRVTGSESRSKRRSDMIGNAVPVCESASLPDLIKNRDESFSEMLMRKISEKGMTNAECYTRAFSTKSVFSKIKNNPNHKPAKPTVAGFVMALELSYDEAKEMFEKAGYSLTRSNVFDIIIEWFLRERIYNIFEINEVLLEYDQQLIGF